MSAVPAAKPTPGLKELLSSAQLPALPQSAIRLLELSQNPDNGPAEFAVPIESDPGLTGQVLRGPAGRGLIGAVRPNEFERRVRMVMDPDGRFGGDA